MHHRNLGFAAHVIQQFKACESCPTSRILAAEVLRPSIYEVYAFPALPYLS